MLLLRDAAKMNQKSGAIEAVLYPDNYSVFCYILPRAVHLFSPVAEVPAPV